MSKTKRRVVYSGAGALLAVAGVYLATGSARARADFDPSALATVERGTMVKSVVATGRIEPVTKVEIKSKANGIIEALRVDVGDRIAPGQVLAELDKETLAARVREARANLQAAEASLRGADAALQKNIIEAEGPDVEFARRAFARATSLFEQRLTPQSGLDEAQSALEVPTSPSRAPRSSARKKNCAMPPSGRPSTAWCSRATSRSAAPSRRSSTWAPRPPW
jgi:HlyD family secretion protein